MDLSHYLAIAAIIVSIVIAIFQKQSSLRITAQEDRINTLKTQINELTTITNKINQNINNSGTGIFGNTTSGDINGNIIQGK